VREVLVAKPGGKLPAQEHVGRLLDREPLWLARAEDFLGDGKSLTVADLRNRKPDETNHNLPELLEILTEFRAARLRLLHRVKKLEPVLSARSLLHARLSPELALVTLPA